MKYLLIVFSALLFATPLFAQDSESAKNALRFGANRAFFEGDVQGTNLYVDYSYSLNSYIAVATSVMSGQAFKKDVINQTASYRLYNQNYVLLMGRFTPFPKWNKWFKADLGGFYQHLVVTDGTGTANPNYNNYYDMNSGSLATGSQYGVLLAGSLGLKIKNFNEIGFRAERYLLISGSYYSDVFFNQLGFYYGRYF